MVYQANTGYAILVFWILTGGPMSMNPAPSTCQVQKKHNLEIQELNPDSYQTDEIRIGLLLPESPEMDPLALAAKEGAELAVQMANKNGGYHGNSYKLVIRTADGLWGAGSKESVKFVYDDEVAAIITAVDGRNAHLAEQVATKAQVVQIATRATDETLSQAFVPWFFRVIPDDRQQARALIDEIFSNHGICEIGLIYEDFYDHRMAAETFSKIAENKGLKIHEMVVHNQKGTDPLSLDIDGSMKALVVSGTFEWAKPVLEEIKKSLPEIQVYGLLHMTADGKIGAGFSSGVEGGIFVASQFCYTTPGQDFKKAYTDQYGYIPSPAASFTYDGTNLLIEAIRQTGPDREKIRDVISKIRYTQGATGPIEFDKHGNRISPVFMVRMIKGHPVILHP